MWGLPQRQGSIHWSTFDVSHQLVERGEACLVRPLPRPCARWLAGRGEKFTTPSVYSSPLLPWLQRLYHIFWNMYVLSRFQYELLVHTPNTDVYRRILECTFTHFAPYVVALSLAPRPSPTWWTCSNSFGLIQPEQYILDYHYCSTSRRGEEPIARLIFWRCQAQDYRRTSSRCRVIYK